MAASQSKQILQFLLFSMRKSTFFSSFSPDFFLSIHCPIIKQLNMLKASRKSQHEHFYLKKLHTESFSQPSLKDEFAKLSDKIEHEIQVVKKHMRVKNLKMFRANKKMQAIENEQSNMRETLRHTIENKLKQGQSNLESMMMTKHTRTQSKDKLRETTLSRIKSMEKTLAEESFRKSQKISKDSESFLIERKHSSSKERSTSYAPTPIRSRYVESEEKTNESMGLMQSRKRILPAVLKITEKDIKQRQLRKSHLEQRREVKNLHEYVEKLNHIDEKRRNRSDRLMQTVKLIQKQKRKQEERYESKKKSESLVYMKEKVQRNYSSATRDAIKNKYSFSQLYAKKLEEKMEKKAYFEEQSLIEGDSIMSKERALKNKKRENRLLSQAIKEVQRKVNFKNMQRYRR